MKTKRIIWLMLCIITGYGISFYFKSSERLDKSVKIDKIVVTKHLHTLQLISNNSIIKTYKVSIGRGAAGPKEYDGDKKTPEGTYYINDKNPNSGYHKNLGISYPAPKDIEHAAKIGKKPGGLVKIHGLKNGLGWIRRYHLLFDWTFGCIALTDKEIDELYNCVSIGTPIEIRP